MKYVSKMLTKNKSEADFQTTKINKLTNNNAGDFFHTGNEREREGLLTHDWVPVSVWLPVRIVLSVFQ